MVSIYLIIVMILPLMGPLVEINTFVFTYLFTNQEDSFYLFPKVVVLKLPVYIKLLMCSISVQMLNKV